MHTHVPIQLGWHGQVVRQGPAKPLSPVRIWVPPSFFPELYLLYIVPTPIGNLQDITLRAIETLKNVDLILAEDTRVTQKLCHHFDIPTPMKSYHSFSEKAHLEKVLSALRENKDIALVSDAGTPGISDPGALLINACHSEGIPVTVLPGANAITTAVVLSGYGELPFQFLGFFPKKKQADTIIKACFYEGISVFYEAPHRIVKTLAAFPKETKITLTRELSKKFEQRLSGTCESLLSHFESNDPRGEMVLLVEGFRKRSHDGKELVQELEKTFGIDQKMALKVAADLLNIPKRELYGAVHE